ncbi:MAG TPA: cytochrome P460 family protein [Schlesneria sp.]
MQKVLALIVAFSISGCNYPSASESAGDRPNIPAHSVPELPSVADEGNDIDPAQHGSLVSPDTFAIWPSVTDEPIDVGPGPWRICRMGPTPEYEHERKAAEDVSGPHANYSITVRVSPDAAQAFRDGMALPPGAIVVKEKQFSYGSAVHYFEEYALMIKHEPGYDELGGDWEYAYVTMEPNRTVTRGKLAECSQCHSKVADNDYLFRLYLAEGKQ